MHMRRACGVHAHAVYLHMRCTCTCGVHVACMRHACIVQCICNGAPAPNSADSSVDSCLSSLQRLQTVQQAASSVTCSSYTPWPASPLALRTCTVAPPILDALRALPPATLDSHSRARSCLWSPLTLISFCVQARSGGSEPSSSATSVATSRDTSTSAFCTRSALITRWGGVFVRVSMTYASSPTISCTTAAGPSAGRCAAAERAFSKSSASIVEACTLSGTLPGIREGTRARSRALGSHEECGQAARRPRGMHSRDA